MNILDYIFIAIMILSGIRCYFRGIVAETLSTAALVLGLVSGVFFYGPTGELANKAVSLGGFREIAGFIIAFLVVFTVVKLVERSIRSTLEAMDLEEVDSVLGFALGIVEGIVACAVIVIFIRYQPVFDPGDILSGSFFSRILLPLIAPHLPFGAK